MMLTRGSYSHPTHTGVVGKLKHAYQQHRAVKQQRAYQRRYYRNHNVVHHHHSFIGGALSFILLLLILAALCALGFYLYKKFKNNKVQNTGVNSAPARGQVPAQNQGYPAQNQNYPAQNQNYSNDPNHIE